MSLWADSPQQAARLALQAQSRNSAWHQQLLPALRMQSLTTDIRAPPCVVAAMVCSVERRERGAAERRQTGASTCTSTLEGPTHTLVSHRQYLCISLASGTRCCGAVKQFSPAHPLQSSVTIGDAHAEVLARRGSISFFLDAAELLLTHCPSMTADSGRITSSSSNNSSARCLASTTHGSNSTLCLYHPFLTYAGALEETSTTLASFPPFSSPAGCSSFFSWRPSVALHLVVTYWPCGFLTKSCATSAVTGSRLLLRSPLLTLNTSNLPAWRRDSPDRGRWTFCAVAAPVDPAAENGCSSAPIAKGWKRFRRDETANSAASPVRRQWSPPHSLSSPPSDPQVRDDNPAGGRDDVVEGGTRHSKDFIEVYHHVLAGHRTPMDMANACSLAARVKPGKGHPNLHMSCSDKIWRWSLLDSGPCCWDLGRREESLAAYHSAVVASTVYSEKGRGRMQLQTGKGCHLAVKDEGALARDDLTVTHEDQKKREMMDVMEEEKGKPCLLCQETRTERSNTNTNNGGKNGGGGIRGSGGVLGKRRAPLLPFLPLSSLHIAVPSGCTKEEMAALSHTANTTMNSVFQSRLACVGQKSSGYSTEHTFPSSPSYTSDDSHSKEGSAESFQIHLFHLHELWSKDGDTSCNKDPHPVVCSSSDSSTPPRCHKNNAASGGQRKEVDSAYSRVTWLSTRVRTEYTTALPPLPSWLEGEQRSLQLEPTTCYPTLCHLPEQPSPTGAQESTVKEELGRKRSSEGMDHNGVEKKGKIRWRAEENALLKVEEEKGKTQTIGSITPGGGGDSSEMQRAMKRDGEEEEKKKEKNGNQKYTLHSAVSHSSGLTKWTMEKRFIGHCEWKWEQKGEGKPKKNISEKEKREMEDGNNAFQSTLLRTSVTLNSKCGLPQGTDEATLCSRYPELGEAFPLIALPSAVNTATTTSVTAGLPTGMKIFTRHEDVLIRPSSSEMPILVPTTSLKTRLQSTMGKEFPLSRAWMFFRVQELAEKVSTMITGGKYSREKKDRVEYIEPFAMYVKTSWEQHHSATLLTQEKCHATAHAKNLLHPAPQEGNLGTSTQTTMKTHLIQGVTPELEEMPLWHSSSTSCPLCWTIKPRYGDSFHLL